jgi:hypothetical protein
VVLVQLPATGLAKKGRPLVPGGVDRAVLEVLNNIELQ